MNDGKQGGKAFCIFALSLACQKRGEKWKNERRVSQAHEEEEAEYIKGDESV